MHFDLQTSYIRRSDEKCYKHNRKTEYIVNRETNERFDKPFSALFSYKTSYKDLEIGDKIGDFEFFDKDGKSLKVYKIYNSKYGVGIKKARTFVIFNTELK